ncbi:MAG: phosphorylase, partial [Methylocella sp.]
MEARIVAGPRVGTVSGTGDALGLERALRAVLAKQPSAIISFGVAGGLAPGLAPGSKLVARAIIAEDGARYYSDPAWSMRLADALGEVTIGDIAGVDAPVAG